MTAQTRRMIAAFATDPTLTTSALMVAAKVTRATAIRFLRSQGREIPRAGKPRKWREREPVGGR